MTLISEMPRALGPGEARDTHTPLWAVFDPEWYRAHYGQAVSDMTGSLPDDRSLYEFWLREGARHAHSPNRYFDEMWYRRSFVDVENGIRMGVFDSGFQHYCETGYRGRSCHWLFSEVGYFSFNPDLTPALLREMGYSNGYDHYLAEGQREHRVSTPFFMPDIVRAGLFRERLDFDPAQGEFARLILSQDLNRLQCSWYFDPVWYLSQYEDVAVQIERGEYFSPLHHYMSNDRPTHYCPNAVFDEQYYLDYYPDVTERVRARLLRNGYDHFIQYGLFEGRNPADGITLPRYDLEGHMPGWIDFSNNAFVDLAKNGSLPAVAPPPELPAPRQLAYLHALRAESLIPLLARTPLDFRYVGKPAVSVIISSPTSFPELMQTLASLHESHRGDMQVVLLDAGVKDETLEIGRYAYGIEPVAVTSTDMQAGWQRAVPRLSADHVLLIESGCHLFYGALDAALSRLDQDGVIAVAPQRLGLDLHVAEAGLSVARDGSCSAYGTGKEAFASEVDFVRPCDSIGGGAFLCHVEMLRSLPQDRPELETLRVREYVWAALGLSLRQIQPSGYIIYDPAFVLRLPQNEMASDAARSREARVLRRYFAELLRGNLPQAPQNSDILHRSPRWGARLLLLARDGTSDQISHRLRLRALSENFIELGLQVTLFVLTNTATARTCLRQDLPERVEFRCGSVDALGQLIEQRARGFDQIWVCGGPVLNDVFPLLNDKAGLVPEERVTLDLRAIEAFEYESDRHTPGRYIAADDPVLEKQLLDTEVMHAWFCQNVVVQNVHQESLLREAGLTGVTILGEDPFVSGDPMQKSRGFADRHNLLFAAQPATVPGYTQKFLKWFVREVLVRLEDRLSGSVRLVLANETFQSLELSMITHYHQVAPLTLGSAAFTDLASTCRVLIAPDEPTGQIALQRLQAASCGLPYVGEGSAITVPLEVSPDPAQFAEAIVTLYQDEETWRRASEAASSQATEMRAVYQRTLARLVGQDAVKEDTGD